MVLLLLVRCYSLWRRPSPNLTNVSLGLKHYILDGTEYFSSHEVHCPGCLEKHHRNGKVTYHHQMLGAVIVCPGRKEVIPLMPEPILRQDGETKNDCERNALKRFLPKFRQDHPHLRVIATLDALYANAPVIRDLRTSLIPWIIRVKSDGHGHQNLSVVLAMLMMLAFLVDQTQQLCCPQFAAAWKKCISKRALWQRVREIFHQFEVTSMQAIYEAVLSTRKPPLKVLWDS